MLDLAVRKWLSGQRLDIGRLARELGLGRATVFRWVGTRDHLYEQVLQRVYAELRQRLLRGATGSGLDLLENVIRNNLRALSESTALRRFLEQDPEHAIRLLTAPGGPVQTHSIALEEQLLTRVVAEAKLQPQLDLHSLAHVIVRIGEAFLYAETIGGHAREIDTLVAAIRVLVTALVAAQPRLAKVVACEGRGSVGANFKADRAAAVAVQVCYAEQVGTGDDDQGERSRQAARALILARRQRFMAAALAGIGGVAGCDALAPPPDDIQPGQPSSAFAVPHPPASLGPPMGGGFARPDPSTGPTVSPVPPFGPSCFEARPENAEDDAGVDDDAGVVEPCVCLTLTLPTLPERAQDEPDGLA